MPKVGYWTTLRHNGVAFTPPYQPKGLRLGFRGEKYGLSPLAEEMAYSWAKKKDTPYVNDSTYAENFCKDLLKQLPMELKGASVKDFDFREFNDLVDSEKREKEQLTKEAKKALAAQRKKAKEVLKERHGYAWIDGAKVEIQNWVVEPPGIFQGRGNHPMRGRWKPRVEEQDVTLNLDVDAPVPLGRWGRIVHDTSSMWLASWADGLSGKLKYVWPHESSFLAQEKNKSKYDKALKLDQSLGRIRKKIELGMAKGDQQARKTATVCYLIDRLCMRVGDEKDEDEADTVGATTLRVEHVVLKEKEICFDFLGKDSVRWLKVLENVEPRVMNNFREFMRGKGPDQLIFDGVTSSKVNSYLGSIVPGLTAKVFRTYHATSVVRDYLSSVEDEVSKEETELGLYFARMANLKAAILCNHKRTPPKTWDDSLKRKEERFKALKAIQPKSAKQADAYRKRLRKAELSLEIAKMTRDYNLNTSLKNYIDPRVYKAWAGHLGFDWQTLYPKTMQKKFGWANRSKLDWMTVSVAHR
ncbi:MAG: DNA topoisomerase I [Conexivisphaerales archaeon]|jgi:DNA topoisomerase-1